MVTAKRAVLLVVALTVGAIVAAFVLPIGVDSIVDDRNVTVTQDEGTTVEVIPQLNSTLEDANNGADANVTLTDADGNSNNFNVTQGTSETVTVGGDDVTVTADTVTDTSATLTFEIPKEFGWGTGAQALWNILDIIIVLALFLFFIGVSLSATDVI